MLNSPTVSSDPQTGQASASPAPRRLLVLAEGHSADPHHGKTARGVIRYRPERRGRDPRLGAGGGDAGRRSRSSARVNDALCFNPTTALVGVATAGGRFPPAWRELLRSCIAKGLDVENGLHEFISDDPELAELAARYGVELRDLRKPPPGLNVPTGENLTHGAKVVLTVGSDCAIGKMTVALELDARPRGGAGSRASSSRPARPGSRSPAGGSSIDAVVADFVAGASERLVLEGVERGGELLWVEGQGSLLHPAYSGVTLGLVHGSAPHAFVLCHMAGQASSTSDERFPMPSLSELVELHERVALLARPAKVAAIALNTRDLDDDGARAAIAAAEAETGLPRTTRCASAPTGSPIRCLKQSAKPVKTRRASSGRDAIGRHLLEAEMRKGGLALACLVCDARACTATAAADLRVGVNDDAGKYESGASWFYPDDGVDRPARERDHAALGRVRADRDRRPSTHDRAGDRARAGERRHGRARHLSAALAGVHERRRAARRRRTRRRAATRRGSSSSPRGRRRVARTFPSVREFIVMNECNQPLFVNPQWDTAGQNQSAAICGRALAAAYDALKGVERREFVWGIGLSPRGNDKPSAVEQLVDRRRSRSSARSASGSGRS